MAEVLSVKELILRVKTEFENSGQAGVDQAKKNLKGLESQTDKTGSAFKKLGRIFAGLAIAKKLTDISGAAIETAARFETTAKSFEVFTGSAIEAEKLLSRLDKFSVSTPFEPEEINEVAKSLLAFGTTTDDLLPDLQAIGEVSEASGVGLDRLGLIFGQVQAKGKLAGEELLQFREAGVPINDILGTINKTAGQSEVSFEELRQAFRKATSEGGKFAGALESQAITLEGLRSTLRGLFTSLLNNIGQRLLTPVKEATKAAIDLVGAFVKFTELPVSEKLREEQAELNNLVTSIQVTNENQGRRNKLIGELQKEYPGFLNNLDAETVTNEQLSERLIDVNKAYVAKIALQEFEEELTVLREKSADKLRIAFDKEERAIAKLNKAIGVDAVQALQARTNSTEELIKLALEENNVTADLIKEYDRGNIALSGRARQLVQVLNLVSSSNSRTKESNELENESSLLKDKIARFQKKFNEELSLFDNVTKRSTDSTKDAEKATNKWAEALQKLGDAIDSEIIQERISFNEWLKAIEEIDKALNENFLESLEENINNLNKGLKIAPKVEIELENVTFGDLSSDIDADFRAESLSINQEALSKLSQNGADVEAIIKERNDNIENLELERLKSLREAAFESGDAEQYINLTGQIFDAEAKQTQERIKDQEEQAKRLREAWKSAYADIISFGSQLFEAQEQEVNKEIALQETRVEKAAALAEKGRTDLVDIEEKRLNELLEKREAALQRQRALANIELAINQALAISNTTKGIASAIGAGFPTALVAVPLMLALIAQLGSGALAVSQALSGVQGFADGTERVRGIGGPRSDNIPAMLSVGERVVPTHINDGMGGISNSELPHAVASYRSLPRIERRLYQVERGHNKITELVKEVKGLRSALSNPRVQVITNHDKGGITQYLIETIDELQTVKNIIG